MIQLPKTIGHWAKTLLAGVISGAANALLASVGVPVAHAAGVPIAPLDWHQMGGIALSGGFIAAVTYLAKSPVPSDDTQQQQQPEQKQP